ncbi:MAG: cupin domain-containing protein [Propionibacteriaceae bacterium]|jgi:quercetin dioxygenase-like cupin family protein|nr:cupin domain-containing protein [Propionibacteriaceae bacterium]
MSQAMIHLEDLTLLTPLQEGATVSRTVLTGDGARVVLFAFDAGQVLTEHAAAMPVLLQVLQGRLRVVADGRDVELRPAGLVYLDARLPHSVAAVTPTLLALTMLDARAAGTTPGAGRPVEPSPEALVD